jgi:hypothetical protein
MSAHVAEQTRPTATIRDLSMKCSVTRAFGNYFMVETETGHKYRVVAKWDVDASDLDAECQCPIRKYRRQRCRHELAVIRFERVRVAAYYLGGIN